MQEAYYFNPQEFDEGGMHVTDKVLFWHLIEGWEKDFHARFFPYKANYLFANASTMRLLDKCFDGEDNERHGMDLINGEVNLDDNLAIEKHSQYTTIYAIGSSLKGNEEEPLFLVVDGSVSDGTAWLKYIDENGDDFVPTLNPVRQTITV